ncbi:MAG: aconitase X [Chloroflexi bacterium]|nr:aconitase X [Chloroflexota bacterium]
MPLTLTDADREMLEGKRGPAARMAMSIVVHMAGVFGADALMDVSAAHVDSTIYIGEAGLEFAERLAGIGAQVAVPTTLNVSGLDEHHWRDWPVPPEWARNARRQMAAYASMGTRPTWTCAPYQTEWKPSFGQQICWGESNAIVFANSVIGARTERYPDLLDICCAITGRVPARGLHLDENRAGEMLIRLVDVPLAIQRDDTFCPVLGHLIGKVAQDRIPVIDGLNVQPTEDQLKALGAAAASSGTVALFHIVGVTPEAPTLDAAFRGRQPIREYKVSMQTLRSAWRELTTAPGSDDRLDMVVLGSPHFSLAEFKQLVPFVADERVHPNVRFLVTTSRAVELLAERAGHVAALKRFGAQLTVDTCILATPMLPREVKSLMTNSGKYAYYAPGMLDTQVTFGTLSDCVRSAVQGRIVRDDSLWTRSSPDESGVSVPPSLDPAFTIVRAAARRTVIPGAAAGEVLAADEPLSFWGGYDYHTGEIVDRRHPLSGKSAAGRILAVPFTRGSSTTTAVLLEAVRAGTAPAALVTTAPDSFFALASIVADEMYGKPIPLVAVPPDEFAHLRSGMHLEIRKDGVLVGL